MAEKKINQPPLQVSPIIKLFRWTCLIYGVVHGFIQRREYSAIEKVIREKEERERPAREARLALQRKLSSEAELRELERMFLGTSSSEEQNESETLKSEERDEEERPILQVPDEEKSIKFAEPNEEEETMESEEC
ncbi:hypothetical protein WH47_01025 [Habropoda laboriosa]|uniref:ATP synthase F(0) complex subunit e, mitochondrial n=1 Tax=Habropoda laboriosa TaxID=597456 RepID=A0A0L7R5H3_9HYME|nr:hypothetical protein WH47_01025 [Habropoda laboriosa]